MVVGSLSNPDGGLFTRLPGFVIPGLGVTFEPPMPNDDYLTTSYVREYEGLADLPDNPLNLLSLGNALVGAAVLHPDYRSVDPDDPANVTLPSTNPNSVYVLDAHAEAADPDGLDGVVPEPILAGLDPVRAGASTSVTTGPRLPTCKRPSPCFRPSTRSPRRANCPRRSPTASTLPRARRTFRRLLCNRASTTRTRHASDEGLAKPHRDGTGHWFRSPDTARLAQVRSAVGGLDPFQRR